MIIKHLMVLFDLPHVQRKLFLLIISNARYKLSDVINGKCRRTIFRVR